MRAFRACPSRRRFDLPSHVDAFLYDLGKRVEIVCSALFFAVQRLETEAENDGYLLTSTLSGIAPRTSVITLDVRLLDVVGDDDDEESDEDGEAALDDESRLP